MNAIRRVRALLSNLRSGNTIAESKPGRPEVLLSINSAGEYLLNGEAIGNLYFADDMLKDVTEGVMQYRIIFRLCKKDLT